MGYLKSEKDEYLRKMFDLMMLEKKRGTKNVTEFFKTHKTGQFDPQNPLYGGEPLERCSYHKKVVAQRKLELQKQKEMQEKEQKLETENTPKNSSKKKKRKQKQKQQQQNTEETKIEKKESDSSPEIVKQLRVKISNLKKEKHDMLGLLDQLKQKKDILIVENDTIQQEADELHTDEILAAKQRQQQKKDVKKSKKKSIENQVALQKKKNEDNALKKKALKEKLVHIKSENQKIKAKKNKFLDKLEQLQTQKKRLNRGKIEVHKRFAELRLLSNQSNQQYRQDFLNPKKKKKKQKKHYFSEKKL